MPTVTTASVTTAPSCSSATWTKETPRPTRRTRVDNWAGPATGEVTKLVLTAVAWRWLAPASAAAATAALATMHCR